MFQMIEDIMWHDILSIETEKHRKLLVKLWIIGQSEILTTNWTTTGTGRQEKSSFNRDLCKADVSFSR